MQVTSHQKQNADNKKGSQAIMVPATFIADIRNKGVKLSGFLGKCLISQLVFAVVLQPDIGVAQDVANLRRLEALLCVVDIPIDVGPVFERSFEPKRVQKSIERLDEFSLDEIEWAIEEYCDRHLSDRDTDCMVKLFVINTYLFDLPASTEVSDEFIDVGYSYFLPKSQSRNLKHPWRVESDGSQTLLISGVAPQHVSGTGYLGKRAFKLFRSRFRRVSDQK